MKYITSSILKLKKRKPNSKKGDFGKILIIGGSEDYAGAPLLAGLAAKVTQLIGADWTTVAAPSKIAWLVNTMQLSLVTIKLEGKYLQTKHANKLIKLAKNYDVLLIGPGITLKAKAFMKKFMANKTIQSMPKVIDADALKLINLNTINNAILTPHENELQILLKNSKLNKTNYKQKLNSNIILLKGNIDKIITKAATYYNKTGNPSMTKAGTGDVLAGVTAGFLAITKDKVKSAKAAAYLTGKAGDAAYKKFKNSYSADELINQIQNIMKK